MKNQLYLTVLWASAVTVGSALVAQTNTVPPLPTDQLHTSMETLWHYGIAVVTPLLIALVKWGVPHVPKLLVVSLAPFVGIALGFAFNAVELAHLSWVDSAQLGALGVFFRELVDQAAKLRMGGQEKVGGA